jgi:hypothetical protein
MKMERLTQYVKVDNLENWINPIVLKVCGHDLALQLPKLFKNPKKVQAWTAGHAYRSESSFILTKEYGRRELAALNSGILFDLDLALDVRIFLIYGSNWWEN